MQKARDEANNSHGLVFVLDVNELEKESDDRYRVTGVIKEEIKRAISNHSIVLINKIDTVESIPSKVFLLVDDITV